MLELCRYYSTPYQFWFMLLKFVYKFRCHGFHHCTAALLPFTIIDEYLVLSTNNDMHRVKMQKHHEYMFSRTRGCKVRTNRMIRRTTISFLICKFQLAILREAAVVICGPWFLLRRKSDYLPDATLKNLPTPFLGFYLAATIGARPPNSDQVLFGSYAPSISVSLKFTSGRPRRRYLIWILYLLVSWPIISFQHPSSYSDPVSVQTSRA